MDKLSDSVEALAQQQASVHATMLNLMLLVHERIQTTEEEGLLFHNQKHLIHVKASTSEPGLTNSTLGAHNMSQMMPIEKVRLIFFWYACVWWKESTWMDSSCEHLFFHGIFFDAEKLELVSMSLEGLVLSWFNWEERHVPFDSWSFLKRRLLRRFGSSQMRTPKNVLAGLQQMISGCVCSRIWGIIYPNYWSGWWNVGSNFKGGLNLNWEK